MAITLSNSHIHYVHNIINNINTLIYHQMSTSKLDSYIVQCPENEKLRLQGGDTSAMGEG